MNPKDKIGQTKPPLHLIPEVANLHEAKALEHGAAKYQPYNWRDEQILASVYVSAARRHLVAWFDGEDLDPDSGVSHLAHVRACIGIMLDAISIDGLIDDRPTPGSAGRVIRELSQESADA